jgi:CHAD domain-containing protein
MRQFTASPPAARANGHGSRTGALFPCGLTSEVLCHLGTSLKTQFKRYCKKLKRCQKRFSEKAVHDSRIETRRLLALLALLADVLPATGVKKVEAALKRHLDTFDDLRDTQVQLPAVSKLLRAFPAARPFQKYLLKREKRFTKRTRRNIKRIKTRRLGKWLNACRQDVAAARQRLAPQIAGTLPLHSVERAFARTRHLRARIDPGDPTTIHCTRVAFKRFRYMVETLADYLPAADGKYLAALHHYQTMMGDIQDAEVLLRTFDKYLLKQKLAAKPARRFRQELVHRRQALIRAFLKASGQLLEFWPPGRAPRFDRR